MATSRHIVPVAFGSYSIDGNAGDLFSHAESGSPTSMPTGAQSYKGRLEGGDIRVKFNAAPTSASGELLSVGDDVLLDSSMLAKLQVILASGSPKLQGHFYNVEAGVFVGGG